MARSTWAAVCFGVALGGGALAAQAGLPLLARVPTGSWQLREIDSDRSPTTICVREAGQLLHLQHPGARCTRYVVSADKNSATVQYSCPGAGQGRTTLTIEDEDALRIATQGIADAAPFDVVYSARRLGPCPSPVVR